MTRGEEIAENLAKVRRRINEQAEKTSRDLSEITLIVVSKNFPTSDIEILYQLGIKDFGENRTEEATLKIGQLPSDITWHFLGQTQSRKVRSIASWADVVHSLDSVAHAKKYAQTDETKALDFFAQVNLEPTRLDRGGIPLAELSHFLESLATETQIMPIGLMAVAPQGLDSAKTLEVFNQVRVAQDQLIRTFPELRYLSMGMSNDFEAAITAGATHLRVGSSILGSRLYGA